MKHLAIIAVLTVVTSFGQAHSHAIVPSDANRLTLRVYKTGIYKGKVHEFVFPKYQGTLRLDTANPEASSIVLALDAAEIKLTDTWLSASDFKSVQQYAVKDMLNADKFKEISFVSTSVHAVDSTHLEVHGTLAMRGVTKPVQVDVTMTPGPTPRFEGRSSVKLTDYGLKPPSAALGLIGTKDEMEFSFTLVAGQGN